MRRGCLLAAALAVVASCEHAVFPPGVRLLRIEIELDTQVAFEGMHDFPDYRPTSEVWGILGDVDLTASGTYFEECGAEDSPLSLEGDVFVRIEHSGREIARTLALQHLSLEYDASDASWSIVDDDLVRIQAEVQVRSAEDLESDHWGEITTELATFYAASDVAQTQIDLTKQWYEIGSTAWGNYGPLEFWIVGSSRSAAKDLDELYCNLRAEKDPLFNLEHCQNRGHSFVSYAKEGNAGLSLIRSEWEQWSGYIVAMSSKNPSPNEDDYKSVLLHEYFHVYQQAHVFSRNHAERESRSLKNPWWTEGGAEYMAQLLYSQQPGVDPNHLKERMRWKMNSRKKLREGEGVQDIPYGDRAMIAYDLGTWFVAFVISKTSEDAYRVGFFRDLNKEGFEGAFVKNFGSSSESFLEEFHNQFLLLSIEEQLAIIP